MDNSKSMNIGYRICDLDKFIKKLKEEIKKLGGIEKFADLIYYSEDTIKNWLNNIQHPDSDTIKKLLEMFKIECEDLGVKAFDRSKIKKDAQKAFSSRLKELIEEKIIKLSQLAKEIGIAKNTVSDWYNGKGMPKEENIQKLCKYFKVSKLYLLGETDIRNANADEITKRTNLTEEEVNNLLMNKQLEDTLRYYRNGYIDCCYAEQVSSILNNVEFYSTISTELSKIMMYARMQKEKSCEIYEDDEKLKEQDILNIDEFYTVYNEIINDENHDYNENPEEFANKIIEDKETEKLFDKCLMLERAKSEFQYIKEKSYFTINKKMCEILDNILNENIQEYMQDEKECYQELLKKLKE